VVAVQDIPARMSDMLKISPEQIASGEFQILSQKESVVGKAYVSEQTQTLFKQLTEAKLKLPRTGRGIDKMMAKVCKISGMPQRLNQHMFRKLFISKAIDLGISEMIWKILTFKTVPISDATYFLNGSELRTYWEKIVSGIPLEKKTNGKASQVDVDMIAKALARLIKKEIQMDYAMPRIGIGLIEEENPMEAIKKYLES
jgi:hypothetical protein